MKILFLTPWYPDSENPNHGIFVREQAVALSLEHQVVVISSKVRYDNFSLSSYALEESVFQHVKEYQLVINRSLPIYNQLNYFLISARVACKIARDFNPDIIHGNIGYPGGFWSWLVSRQIKRPFIITEHTFIYNNFRSFLHRNLTLFSFRRAAIIITVSQKAAAEIKRYVDRIVRVVPNIVDITRYQITPYPKTPVAIGFLGGLSSRNHVKGLDKLMIALSKIEKDFVLHIGGGGVLFDEYKELANRLGISDKCKFLGFISPDNVPDLMNHLHFFVNASRFESFGIAIGEALVSGLPVVSFDNGGPADFVNHANGILVENQNEEKLKDAIEWMLDNYYTYDRVKIRASVADRFSREAFMRLINPIYQEVCR